MSKSVVFNFNCYNKTRKNLNLSGLDLTGLRDYDNNAVEKPLKRTKICHSSRKKGASFEAPCILLIGELIYVVVQK